MSLTTSNNKAATETAAVAQAASGTAVPTDADLLEELRQIEAMQNMIRYRYSLLDAVLLCRDRAAAEAHLTSTTAMTAAEVSRVLSVSFGEVTRDRREALDVRRYELKRALGL